MLVKMWLTKNRFHNFVSPMQKDITIAGFQIDNENWIEQQSK